jgi:hypothetical protein
MTEARRPDAAERTKHLAYAEASLMLIEGLMQALLERKLLTLDELRSIVDNAIETKQAFVDARVHPEISTLATGILRRLGNSISATREARHTD